MKATLAQKRESYRALLLAEFSKASEYQEQLKEPYVVEVNGIVLSSTDTADLFGQYVREIRRQARKRKVEKK